MITPMDIPDFAKLVYGLRWGGWAWMSWSPQGSWVWWVAFWEQGSEALAFRRFHSITEIEMYFDAVDIQDGSTS
jgi:hypothetical protein